MAVRSGITLLSLLESHELPESLKYDKETSGKSSAKSTSVSSRAVEVTPECVLREDDHLLNRVHHTLERLSTFISSSHTFPPGSLLPDSSQLVEIDREFKTVTSRARREATREKMSAETGESHFLKAHLVNPLNLLLEVLFPHLRVYWRFVGLGSGGKPDIELVIETEGALVKSAVCEIKTVDAVSQTTVRRIPVDAGENKLYMKGNEVVTEDDAELERGKRSHQCKVVQQVSISLFITYLTLSKRYEMTLFAHHDGKSSQVLGEMFTRDVSLGLITNYEQFLLLRRDHRDRSSQPIISFCDPIQASGPFTRRRLANTPLGLFLGVTALALEWGRHDTRIDGTSPAGAGEMEVNARTPSETVRDEVGEGSGSGREGSGFGGGNTGLGSGGIGGSGSSLAGQDPTYRVSFESSSLVVLLTYLTVVLRASSS